MGDTLTFATLLRLAISLGLLIAALYGVKHWQRRPGTSRKGAIDIIARASLGRSSSIHIVEVDHRRFLVGAGEHQVTLLSELDGPSEGQGTSTPQPERGLGAGMLSSSRPTADPATTRTPDGTGSVSSQQPRIGLLDRLRTVTVRTPQQTRVIRDQAL
jgi:flagellar biosynthetic protein FliO